MGILELLFVVSSKPVVVGLACLGALLATLAPLARRLQDRAGKSRGSVNQPGRTGIEGMMVRAGYGVMGVSVLLFIVAGFISDLG